MGLKPGHTVIGARILVKAWSCIYMASCPHKDGFFPVPDKYFLRDFVFNHSLCCVFLQSEGETFPRDRCPSVDSG